MNNIAKRAKGEKKVKNIKLDQDVNDYVQKVAENEEVTFSFLVNELLKSMIEQDKQSSLGEIMSNSILNKTVNVWVMGCKYSDGKTDDFQEVLNKKKLYIGWGGDKIHILKDVKNKKERDDFFEEREKNDKWDNINSAKGAYDRFVDKVKIGDYIILKQGISGIHAVVKVKNDIKLDSTAKTFYREIEHIVIFDDDKQKQEALDLYKEEHFGRKLKQGTIYSCEQNGSSIWGFILEAIQDIK